jgi:hypothetical protein
MLQWSRALSGVNKNSTLNWGSLQHEVENNEFANTPLPHQRYYPACWFEQLHLDLFDGRACFGKRFGL